eukprot:6000339-Pleurochrysis_carterae.AAC.1
MLEGKVVAPKFAPVNSIGRIRESSHILPKHERLAKKCDRCIAIGLRQKGGGRRQGGTSCRLCTCPTAKRT